MVRIASFIMVEEDAGEVLDERWATVALASVLAVLLFWWRRRRRQSSG
jgi:MYXO-CTERM domain-containing protein